MIGIDKLENAEGLEDFNSETGKDYTFDLYRTLNSDEQIREFGEKCSEFYYLPVFPYGTELKRRKDVPELYEIISKLAHGADGFCLELLIGRHSDESMRVAKEKTEEMRKKFEKDGLTFFTVRDPYLYTYVVGYFGGSSGRAAQSVIRELKNMFPGKFKELKHK